MTLKKCWIKEAKIMMKKQSIRLLREFETNNKIEGNKIIFLNIYKLG